jgi:hypothetical protein
MAKHILKAFDNKNMRFNQHQRVILVGCLSILLQKIFKTHVDID